MVAAIPFFNNAASLAASRAVYYPSLGLSQLTNIFYAFRDGARNETVIPKERYIDYGVRGYLGTIIMAYTYELGFRLIEAGFTAPNMAKALGFDELSRWYSKKGKQSKFLDVASLNEVKSVVENITGPLAKPEGFSDFADQAYRLYESNAQKTDELTGAKLKAMEKHLPKVLEYLRRMRFYDYREYDYINYILRQSESQSFIQDELKQYASMKHAPSIDANHLEKGVGLLRELMGEAEASTKLINEIAAQSGTNISLLPKWWPKKKTLLVEDSLDSLRQLKDDALAEKELSITQRLKILKSIQLNPDDLTSWHHLEDKLAIKLIKPILDHYHLPVPKPGEALSETFKALTDKENGMVHRAILNAQQVFKGLDSEKAVQQAMQHHQWRFDDQIQILEHFAQHANATPMPELQKTLRLEAYKEYREALEALNKQGGGAEQANTLQQLNKEWHQKIVQDFKDTVDHLIESKQKDGLREYNYADVLRKFRSEEMTWAESQVKGMIAPWKQRGEDVLKDSQIYVRAKKLFNVQEFKQVGRWLNHYVGEGFKSWRVQREMAKISHSEMWPKLLLTTGMNIFAHGFFLSIAEVKWAQKLERELVAEGIAPDKVFRGPMYGGLIPAVAIYASMMWQPMTRRIPVLGKSIQNMSRLARHGVAGALGLLAYGLTVVQGTHHNIRKERLKKGHNYHYHPQVAAHHKEVRLDPITFNQFALSHLNEQSTVPQRYARSSNAFARASQ